MAYTTTVSLWLPNLFFKGTRTSPFQTFLGGWVEGEIKTLFKRVTSAGTYFQQGVVQNKSLCLNSTLLFES